MSGKWHIGHDPGEEAWCVVIKTIRSMGFQGGIRPRPIILMVLGPEPQAKGVGIMGRVVGSKSGCRTLTPP